MTDLSKPPGRNDKCTCGSGIKFKKCCMDKPFQGPVQKYEVVERTGVKAWFPLVAAATVTLKQNKGVYYV